MKLNFWNDMLTTLENKNITFHGTNPSMDLNQNELLLLQRKIAYNFRDEMNKICHSSVNKEKDTFIVKINLERATADNFKIFSDFTNSHIDYNHTNFILDMSKALFMDSTFLGCIVVFYKKVHKNGGKFKMVVNMEKIKILTPFEQLSKILNVYPTLDEALSNI